ncbi:MAG: hypothetical protein QM764_22980 [Chitinophagaceae bacterium]
MNEVFYVRIKKEYATAVIEDLQKMEAVELLREEDIEIPDWQKELVRIEKKKVETNPSILVDWEKAKLQFKR